MPAGQPVGVHGKKRALVCGVLYRNTGRELKGSVNDAMCMKFLLRNRFNFPEASILMLTGNFVLFVLIFLITLLICLVVLKMWERRGNDRKGKRDDFCDLVVLIGLQAKLGKERRRKDTRFNLVILKREEERENKKESHNFKKYFITRPK